LCSPDTYGFFLKKRPDIRLTGTNTCPQTTMNIDKGKLHQVILNLILNAAKASPKDGAIELLAYYSEGFYCLAVRDYGSGISPVVKDKVFEIFYTTGLAGEGSGIGLAVCKSIVELHKGKIMFNSRPGETTFVVKIPLNEGVINGET